MNDNVKQDINFLEYPLWMQQTKKATGQIVTWKDKEGYTFEAAGGVPSKVDMLFLYYFMLEAQNSNWDETLVLSRYQVLNGCGMNVGKTERDRLKRSLEIWKRVTISFSGTFYSGQEYHDMEFGIINDWVARKKDNKLEIELNKRWIEKIKQSEFFKYISFGQMKALRSPLALRLYEILVKTFYRRDSWDVDVFKLAQKIPMTEKYVAHITPKIKAATKRISDKTELNIKVQLVKQGRGKGKFVFTRKSKQKPRQQDLFPSEDTGKPQVAEIPQEMMVQIPEQWRGDAQGMAVEILQKSGAGELDECILFVNDAIAGGIQIKKGYGAYLRSAYQGGWHRDAKATKEADGKAKAQAEKADQIQKNAVKSAQAQKDAEQVERECTGKAIKQEIEDLTDDQLAALDGFIERQDLNKMSRQLFLKGRKTGLRIQFITDFLDEILKTV